MLYQAYILPVLDYCDTVWLPSNSSSTRRLERLHSKFTPSFDSSDTFNFRSSLTERRTFHTAVQVFKILNKIPLLIYRGFFHMLWMLLVALVETYTDYLFQVLELIMENSLWRTGVRPYGTDYLKHYTVLKL